MNSDILIQIPTIKIGKAVVFKYFMPLPSIHCLVSDARSFYLQ